MEIYVKEMPKSCKECPCSFQDVATCKWCNAYKKGKLTFISDDIYKEKRFEDCPLKLLKDHDKEFVAKVCEYIKDRTYENVGYHICECGKKFDIECVDFEDLCEIIDKIQKEFEDE